VPSNSVFQGYLRISLVSVPVRAYSAVAPGSGQIAFNQLHEECGRRIQYKKFCPTHGPVAPEEIVSGYEYEKNKYVVFDPGEIDALRTKKDRSIDIAQFVKADQIDPLYETGKDYYLVPDGVVGQKPYQLIHQSMAESRVCGIAQVVISRREELVLVRAAERLLLMTVLRYAHELKSPQTFVDQLDESQTTKQESDLTAQLIKALTVKTFDPSAFHDLYEERLHELIDAKIKGRQIAAPAEEETPEVINLMDAIRKSMKQLKPKSASKDSPRKKSKPQRPVASAAHRRKSG
jgi:DNA end-binding protein Ku